MTNVALNVAGRSRYSRWLKATAIVAGVALAVAWASLWTRDSETTLARIRRTGEIRIGYAVEPPYAYVGRGANVTGESPEIVKVWAARLDIPHVIWVQTSFDALIPELELGRFDLIAAGMHITKSRAERVAFTCPTFQGQPALLVVRGNPQHLRSCADVIAQPEVKIAVLSGAVEVDAFHSCGVPREQLLVVPDAIAGRAAVESHLVDGLALTEPTIRWMVQHSERDELEMVAPFGICQNSTLKPSYGGFALRKTDPELLEACEIFLTKFVGSDEHQALIAGFGFGAENLPGDIRLEELLRR